MSGMAEDAAEMTCKLLRRDSGPVHQLAAESIVPLLMRLCLVVTVLSRDAIT